MRLTINLDEDLYALARSHAIASKTSISKAVGSLLRRQTTAHSPAHNHPLPDFSVDPVTLLPIVKGVGSLITSEDVQHALNDEDHRFLEMAGTPPAPSPRS